jgi:hypothetical protein
MKVAARMQLRILNPSAETAARDRAARIRLIKVATHGQVVRAAVAAEADRSVVAIRILQRHRLRVYCSLTATWSFLARVIALTVAMCAEVVQRGCEHGIAELVFPRPVCAFRANCKKTVWLPP